MDEKLTFTGLRIECIESLRFYTQKGVASRMGRAVFRGGKVGRIGCIYLSTSNPSIYVTKNGVI